MSDIWPRRRRRGTPRECQPCGGRVLHVSRKHALAIAVETAAEFGKQYRPERCPNGGRGFHLHVVHTAPAGTRS